MFHCCGHIKYADLNDAGTQDAIDRHVFLLACACFLVWSNRNAHIAPVGNALDAIELRSALGKRLPRREDEPRGLDMRRPKERTVQIPEKPDNLSSQSPTAY
jgi:hypothetical protein